MKNPSYFCPDMIEGSVTKSEISESFDNFDLYRPKFLNDVLDRTCDLDRAYVYLKKQTHDELRPYHYCWETLAWILLHNGQDEDKGGTRIYKRMKELEEMGYPDTGFLKDMEKHVADEKRHSHLFMEAAEIVAVSAGFEVADNEDPTVGEEIVDDLLTHVPMSDFKMMAAIFSIEFRSYVMIRNTMKHFYDAIGKNAVFQKVFETIESIPPDEKFHVEYTAKFLERELAKSPENYESMIGDIVESMEHAGFEMCSHMDKHYNNIASEGGFESLTPILN